MASTSSNLWSQLGAGALAGALGYVEGKQVDVANNSGDMTNPDIVNGYYGYAGAQQPTYGASSGSSSVLVLGVLAALAVGAFILLKRR